MHKEAKNNIHKIIGSILFISVLLSVFIGARAQKQVPNQRIPQNIKIIELRSADEMLKRANSEAIVLKNNVVLYHDGALMQCDSAYWFEKSNSFQAFSNVMINQGDTLFVSGDYMSYDGLIKFAKLRYNVRMKDKKATLFTDSLDFDRVQNLGYYFDGGMLVDEENELTSYWGEYNTITKDALFRDSVKLVNKDYTIYSNQLKYNTASKIADLMGPSTIVSDSGTIHTSQGWYNTVTEDSQLTQNSEVISSDGTKTLTGNIIDYNRKTGIGKVQGDMKLHDKLRKVMLFGNYGYYKEKPGYAIATDSAYVIDYSQKDSLFLRGDTLEMTTDSIYRELKAIGKVRYFRNDIQGISETMHYVSKDSVLYMKGNPVVWNKNQQVMGDQIDVFMKDSVIRKALIKNYAFAIQQREDVSQYNQIKGKNMTIDFDKGDIRFITVEGGVESVYYMLDKDKKLIGLNFAQGPVLKISMLNEEIEIIKLIGDSKATLTPMFQIQEKDKTLSGFQWLDNVRPKNKNDIFRTNSLNEMKEITHPKRFVRDQDVIR